MGREKRRLKPPGKTAVFSASGLRDLVTVPRSQPPTLKFPVILLQVSHIDKRLHEEYDAAPETV
jgi:hypothetical protein